MRLWEEAGMGAIGNFIGDFFTTMGREAVHYNDV